MDKVRRIDFPIHEENDEYPDLLSAAPIEVPSGLVTFSRVERLDHWRDTVPNEQLTIFFEVENFNQGYDLIGDFYTSYIVGEDGIVRRPGCGMTGCAEIESIGDGGYSAGPGQTREGTIVFIVPPDIKNLKLFLHSESLPHPYIFSIDGVSTEVPPDESVASETIISTLNSIEGYKFTGNQKTIDPDRKIEYEISGAYMKSDVNYFKWTLLSQGAKDISDWYEAVYTDTETCQRSADIPWKCFPQEDGTYQYSARGLIRLVEGQPFQSSSTSSELIKTEYQGPYTDNYPCHFYSVQEQRTEKNTVEDRYSLVTTQVCFDRNTFYPLWMNEEVTSFLEGKLNWTTTIDIDFFDINKPVQIFIPEPTP